MGDFQGQIIHGELFLDIRCAVRGAQRTFDKRDNIVRDQGDAKAKQRRLRIAERIHFTREINRQVLKGGFNRPAVGVQSRDLRSRSRRHRQIGEDMQLSFAIARRRVQLDRDPADAKGGARVRLRYTQGLFIERLSPRIVADAPAGTLGLAHHIRGMVANHKKRAAARYAKQKPQRAKIAIGHDTVPLRHHRHHCGEQCPLLRIGVFTRNDLRGHLPLRIIENQGVPRQCRRPIATEFFHPMLRPRQMVPVQHPHAIARQQRRRGRGLLLQAGSQFSSCILHQSGRRWQFEMLQFVVHRLPRDRHLVVRRFVPGPHTGHDAKDHIRHQLDTVRKGQLAGVLQQRIIAKHAL